MNRARHEPHVVDTRTLYRLGAGFAAILVGIVIAMYLLWRAVAPPPAAPLPALPPGPSLQAHAPVDRAMAQHRQQALLDSYGWVDRPHGVARIPVDRAMALLVSPAPASTGSSGGAR